MVIVPVIGGCVGPAPAREPDERQGVRPGLRRHARGPSACERLHAVAEADRVEQADAQRLDVGLRRRADVDVDVVEALDGGRRVAAALQVAGHVTETPGTCGPALRRRPPSG